MTVKSPLTGVHALQGQVIDCQSLVSQLIRIEERCGHGGNMQRLMKDENESPEGQWTIISYSSGHHLHIANVSQLFLKTTDSYSSPSLLQNLGTLADSASVCMGVHLHPSMGFLKQVKWVSRVR